MPVISTPAINAHTQVGPACSRFIPLPTATRSAEIFNAFATINATSSTTRIGRALARNFSVANSPSPRPVARAVRSQISCTPAINGNVSNDTHNNPSPNCAPACEYVATPDGSSSEAPVTKPGPNARKYPRHPGGEPALVRSTSGFPDGPSAGGRLGFAGL